MFRIMGYEREEDYKDIDVEMLRIVVEAAQKRYISIRRCLMTAN